MFMVNCCVAIREFKLVMALILCQIASGGVSVFYKIAVANGMKVKILVAYRLIFATISIAPLALVIERKTRPKLTWMIAFQGLACGLLGGALGSNLYAESLVLTSTTFATAMINTIPALTLIMAVVFRLETLEIRSSAGKAKVIGTALGIGGAMILTLYNGMTITIWSTHFNLLHHFETTTNPQTRHNHLAGCLLALAACISYAAWLIVQAKMSQNYPNYSSTAIVCFSGTIMSAVYALCLEPHWDEWKIGWNIRLLAAVFMGIIGTGFSTVVTAWGMRVRGPLYVSSFSPLALIFIVVFGSLILDEELHLGSIIGSLLIIVGLYIVLWGKSKEIKMAKLGSKETGDGNLETSADKNQIDNSVVAGHRKEEKATEATEEV